LREDIQERNQARQEKVKEEHEKLKEKLNFTI